MVDHQRNPYPEGVNVFKKIIAPVAIGGALLGGTLTVATTGAAYAATPAASTTAPSSPHKGQVKAWVRSHRKELRKAGLDISAKTIGVTPQALRADLKAGNSIAGVASQHNVNPQSVINALVSAADTQVNQAVSANKLTSTQASKIEAKIPGWVAKVVNHTF
jgi:urease alpha subunit